MFEYPKMLFLFLTIPIFVFILLFDIIKNHRNSTLISGVNRSSIIPYYSEGQKWVRTVFMIFGLAFAILAIARPRWGTQEITANLKGRDVLFLVDVSNSMLVPDVFPNRLELVKRNLSAYVSSGTTDRIGLVVFSSEAELIVPFTTDYGALLHFIDAMYPAMVGNGGTDIPRAINATIDFFEQERLTDKIIVLVTDGEDVQGNSQSLEKKIKQSSVKICTVGVGTPNGQPIPIKNDKDAVETYIRDKSGSPVVSRLDEQYLKTIAQFSNAAYHRLSTSFQDFNFFINTIGGKKTLEQEKKTTLQTKDQCGLFILPALLCFSIAFFLDLGKLRYRKNKYSSFRYLSNLCLIILFLHVPTLIISQEQENLKQDQTKELSNKLYKNGAFFGNRRFKKQDYSGALKEYSRAVDSFSGDQKAQLLFNIGSSFIQQKDYENAISMFEQAAEETQDKTTMKNINFNLGYAHFQKEQYDKAMASFLATLILDGDDEDARYNFALSKLLLENQDQQEQDEENNTQENNQTNNDILDALENKERNEQKESQKSTPTYLRGQFW